MAPPARGIVLVGMRGAGKTTVGALLARALGWTFDDLDELALARTGLGSVRDVFAERGEAGWRLLEAEALAQHGAARADGPGHGCVLAVGGGAPCDDRCRELLLRARAAGWRIVWLRASLPALVERLRGNEGDRPRLTAAAFEEELAQLDSVRSACYGRLADDTIDADGTPDEVTGAILRSIA